VRALVLSTLCLLLPAIAVYIIVLAPLNAQVFTRQIQPTSSMFAQMLDTNSFKVFAVRHAQQDNMIVGAFASQAARK
jgi:hypothetical protein